MTNSKIISAGKSGSEVKGLVSTVGKEHDKKIVQTTAAECVN